MPARVGLSRGHRKPDGLGSQNLQRGLQVFGGDMGDGEHGHRSNKELCKLMFALRIPDGVMDSAREVMRERRVVARSDEGKFGRCLRDGVDCSGDPATFQCCLFGSEIFHNTEGNLKDARLDGLNLDVRSQGWGAPALRGNLLVHFLHGLVQLSADGSPFYRLKVVVLQEDHERRGADDGGVLPEELGPAVFGVAVRGRLRGREVGDGNGGMCHLFD